MPLKKVTVAVDFDTPSHVAARYASAFCRPFGVELDVLHVADDPHGRVLEKLGKWTAEIGVNGKLKVLGGRAAETIVDAMPASDLLIMGTHRRSELATFFLGSVAEKVVRAGTRPILVVPETVDCTVPPVKILAPVDFSGTSLAAFELAMALALRTKSDVVALSVIEVVAGLAGPPTLSPVAKPGTPLESYYDVAHRNTTKRVEELLRERQRVTADVRIAHPVMGICAAAKEHKADLIVMGTRGRTGLAHFGSVAERTLRRAPCPVLVVHEGPAAESTERAD